MAWLYLDIREKVLFGIGMFLYTARLATLYAIPVLFGMVVDRYLAEYVYTYVGLQFADVILVAILFVIFNDVMMRGRYKMLVHYIVSELEKIYSRNASGDVVSKGFSASHLSSLVLYHYVAGIPIKVTYAFLVMIYVLIFAPLIGIGALMLSFLSMWVMRHTDAMAEVSEAYRKQLASAEKLSRDILMGREDITMLNTSLWRDWFEREGNAFVYHLIRLARVSVISFLESRVAIVIGKGLMFVGMAYASSPGKAIMFYYLAETAGSVFTNLADDIDYIADIIGGANMMEDIGNASS